MIAHDPYNAFCRHTHVALNGAADGPLHGLSFAVKDVFDLAGHRTGNGNPVWLETHAPALRTASSVERLLAAGARMIGKTHTDELAYSLNGENVHYGTPINPKAPGRIPGGSSSGSAAAVSGGLVDFAPTASSISLRASTLSAGLPAIRRLCCESVRFCCRRPISNRSDY
jgi:amidase